MVKKVKKIVEETLKKAKKIKEQSGAPEPGTVGARKTTPKVAPKPKAKAKPKVSPTAGKPRGRPKGSKNKPKAKPGVVANNKGKIAAAALATPVIIGGGIVGNRARKRRNAAKASEAAKVSFGDAFKEARKKGEGTKFTWDGKSYTAVTKDDLKKKGYDANELKQYANRKGKARGPVRRAAQGIKKVLLGKDKKFGGDKGAIDFIRRSKPKKKMDGGMANSSKPKKYQSGGMAPVAGPRRPSKSTLNADLASGRALSGRVGPPRVGPPARPTAPKKVNPRGNPSFGPPGLNKGGMAPKKYKAGGLATKGLGKAYMNSKR